MLSRPGFVGRVGVSLRLTSSGPAAPTPVPSGLVEYFDPATLSGVGAGGSLTSWTGSIAGVAISTAAAPVGATTAATWQTNVVNGLPAVRFAGTTVLGNNAAGNVVTNAISSGKFTVVVALANQAANGSIYGIFACGTGANCMMTGNGTVMGGYVADRYPYTDTSGTTAAVAVDSALSSQQNLQSIAGSAMATNSINNPGARDFYLGGGLGSSTWCGRFDCLGVWIFNRKLTATELTQMDMVVCEKLGKPYRFAGRPFLCTVGDSITFGSSSTNTNTGQYGWRVASALNMPFGTFHFLGLHGDSYAGMLTRFNREIVGLPALIKPKNARPIVSSFEYANAVGSGAVNIQNSAITFLTAAKAAQFLTVHGTTTDLGTTAGIANRAERTAVNDYWDVSSNRVGLVDGYVQIHLDPNIGVIGAAPAVTGSPSTYFDSSRIHPVDAGYVVLAGLFRPVIAAL